MRVFLTHPQNEFRMPKIPLIWSIIVTEQYFCNWESLIPRHAYWSNFLWPNQPVSYSARPDGRPSSRQSWCTNLKFVGNRSTITQYTVLMPKEVSASNIHDKIKFSNELCTKYNPIVTAAATTKLNTVNGKLKKIYFFQEIRFWAYFKCVPKKNLVPSRCTHSGSQKLVGIHAKPMIMVCKKTLSSMGPPQNLSCSTL